MNNCVNLVRTGIPFIIVAATKVVIAAASPGKADPATAVRLGDRYTP